ncbi:unnamed protein product, partial [Allacma fusca]
HDATGNAVVSGWGALDWDGEYPDVLHKVLIPIVSDQVCIAAYGGYFVASSNICAGYLSGGKDSCDG